MVLPFGVFLFVPFVNPKFTNGRSVTCELHTSYIPKTFKMSFIYERLQCLLSIKTSLQLHTSYIPYAQNGTYPLLFRLWFSVFSSLIFPAIKVSFIIRDAIG